MHFNIIKSKCLSLIVFVIFHLIIVKNKLLQYLVIIMVMQIKLLSLLLLLLLFYVYRMCILSFDHFNEYYLQLSFAKLVASFVLKLFL